MNTASLSLPCFPTPHVRDVHRQDQRFCYIGGGAAVELLATGKSDDGTVNIWEAGDEGTKTMAAMLEIRYPVGCDECMLVPGVQMARWCMSGREIHKNEQWLGFRVPAPRSFVKSDMSTSIFAL